MKFFALAMIGTISAFKMDQHNSHACDFIDDKGEEISTSLMPESFVQLESKIRTKDDLAAIHTLGFRGEAIPSIASVSKFRLTTREPDSLTGTEILINGGKVVSVKDCGEPPGTQIEVRSLFYNLPARRKFLRTENTEYSHLEQVIKTQAIAHENTSELQLV